jgi:hypothetical protein
MFFKFFLNFGNVTTKNNRSLHILVWLDFKLSLFPMSDNFLFKRPFKLQLLVSRFSDLLNFFTELEEWALE